jgi:hypothetical protein
MHATMMTESVIPFKVFRIYIQNKVQNCMPREYSRHALPVTVPVVKALKRIENVDYFDIDTDFNPLHLRTLRTTPEDAETSPALSRQQIP